MTALRDAGVREPGPVALFGGPRAAFLHNLRSKGKLDYKRYLGTPLRYAGGKSLGVGYIVELLPDDLRSLVSPFIGGGSVEVALAREMGVRVAAYDVFDVLCNYWDAQLHDAEGLYRRLSAFSPDRDTFREVKQRLNVYWRNGDTSIDKRDLAALFYFNFNTSYGPHFLGWPSDIYLNEARYSTLINKVRRFRASGLSVSQMSFEESIPRHEDEFLYCDPPYYLEDGKTFVGMYPHRNFPIHHKGFRHDLLRDLLLAHKGGFVLSYNDCEVVRDWYADCEISEPQWQYTFGQGDTRIGENRAHRNGGSHIKKSHELLIRKLPIASKA